MKKPEKFWDKIAIQSESHHNSHEQDFSKLVERSKKYLKNEDKVLDFACGSGIHTNEVAGYVKQVVAIDTSAKMIEVAKRKADERGINNIDYLQTTVFDGRLIEESFYVVLAFNILHILEDNQKVLKRINELLMPGGLFISVTACMGDKKSLLSRFMLLLSKIGVIPTIYVIKSLELEYIVGGAGFNIIETVAIDNKSAEYYIVAEKV